MHAGKQHEAGVFHLAGTEERIFSHVLSLNLFVKLELLRRLQKAPVAFLIRLCLYFRLLNVLGRTFTPEL